MPAALVGAHWPAAEFARSASAGLALERCQPAEGELGVRRERPLQRQGPDGGLVLVQALDTISLKTDPVLCPEGKGDGKAYFLSTCYVLGTSVLPNGFRSQF